MSGGDKQRVYEEHQEIANDKKETSSAGAGFHNHRKFYNNKRELTTTAQGRQNHPIVDVEFAERLVNASVWENVNNTKKMKLSCEHPCRTLSFVDMRKLAVKTGCNYQMACCTCGQDVKKLREQVAYWRETAKSLQDIVTSLNASLVPNHIARKQRTVATNTPKVTMPTLAFPGFVPPELTANHSHVQNVPVKASSVPTNNVLRNVLLRPGVNNLTKSEPNKQLIQKGSPNRYCLPGGQPRTVAGPSIPARIRPDRTVTEFKGDKVCNRKLADNKLVDLTVDEDDDNSRPDNSNSCQLTASQPHNPKLAIGHPGTNNELLPPLPQASSRNGQNRFLPKVALHVEHMDLRKVTLRFESTEENANASNVNSYELFVFQRTKPTPFQWKCVQSLKALELPMACVVTLSAAGARNERFHFTVRAVGKDGSTGEASEPQLVTLIEPQHLL